MDTDREDGKPFISQEDWAKSGAAFEAICQDLVKAMSQGASPKSSEAQAVIRRHYEWLKRFWTPNRISYAGHSDLMLSSDLRKAYEKHDAELPEFAATAMKEFAEQELA